MPFIDDREYPIGVIPDRTLKNESNGGGTDEARIGGKMRNDALNLTRAPSRIRPIPCLPASVKIRPRAATRYNKRLPTCCPPVSVAVSSTV